MRGTVAPGLMSLPLLAAAAVSILLVAGTMLLWAHYGTAVFFEVIRAGFLACFG
jgi:hypothetical protein